MCHHRADCIEADTELQALAVKSVAHSAQAGSSWQGANLPAHAHVGAANPCCGQWMSIVLAGFSGIHQYTQVAKATAPQATLQSARAMT